MPAGTEMGVEGGLRGGGETTIQIYMFVDCMIPLESMSCICFALVATPLQWL